MIPPHPPRIPMLLSSTVRYTLAAAACLARKRGDGEELVRMQEVAEATGIPTNYLSKLFHRLVQDGVLLSRRGPTGGFGFLIPPEELTLARLTAPFMASEGPVPCLISNRDCDPSNPCIAHDDWVEMAHGFRSYFRSTSVADLVHAEDPSEASGTLDLS